MKKKLLQQCTSSNFSFNSGFSEWLSLDSRYSENPKKKSSGSENGEVNDENQDVGRVFALRHLISSRPQRVDMQYEEALTVVQLPAWSKKKKKITKENSYTMAIPCLIYSASSHRVNWCMYIYICCNSILYRRCSEKSKYK